MVANTKSTNHENSRKVNWLAITFFFLCWIEKVACLDLNLLDSLCSKLLFYLCWKLFVVPVPETGRLMARYCIAFDTMKQFSAVVGTESMEEIVSYVFNFGSNKEKVTRAGIEPKIAWLTCQCSTNLAINLPSQFNLWLITWNCTTFQFYFCTCTYTFFIFRKTLLGSLRQAINYLFLKAIYTLSAQKKKKSSQIYK